MKAKYAALFVGLVCIISACKKNDYSNSSTTTQPVFSFNGSVNGAPLSIQAGVNNYFLNTSYAKDNNGVYNFTGEFMTQGCSGTCPNSLEVFFKDSSTTPSLTIAHVNTVIRNGYYSYSTPLGQPSGYYVQFQDFMNNAIVSYAWNFGDGQTGNTHNPVHYYYRPGIYKASVTLNSGSCASSDTNMVLVGQCGGFYSAFSNSFSGLTTMFANAINGGTPPYTYLWQYGDGNSSTQATPTYTYSAMGVYHVTSSVTDATGFTNTQSINEATQGFSGCAGGFYENIPLTPQPNPYNFNDVGVAWYDASGNLWTSESNKQHYNSFFKVTAVSDYMNNSNNQAVKMVTAQIKCELYNGADSIPISGTAIFGVAHY